LIHERESLLKSFSLFFLTMILSLGAITYLLYRTELLALKGSLFLELKNYSYTFEGERFSLDVVEVGKGDRFYELYEGKEGLYILVPVPGTKKDALSRSSIRGYPMKGTGPEKAG